MPRIRLAVLPAWASFDTLRTRPAAGRARWPSPRIRPRFPRRSGGASPGRRPGGPPRARSHRSPACLSHDPDAGSFRILDRELEEGDGLAPGGLDLLPGGPGCSESGHGDRSRYDARGQDDARDDDLVALRGVAAQTGQVHLGPILPGTLETVRDVSPDLGARLPPHVAELADDALEGRGRLGGLGHEKGLGDRGQRPDRLKHLGARLQVRGLWQRIPKTQRAAASWWERGGLGRAVVVLSRPVGATGPQKY